MAGLIKMPLTGADPACSDRAVYSWESAEAQAVSVEGMPDAVTYFRRVLGETWWGKATKAQHAVVFHTSFQDGPREWVRLHRLARALEGVADLDDLVRQGLGSRAWNNYVAAVMTLEFCGRAKAKGHEVELVANGNEKIPDARVKLSRRGWVTIEFKALHDPDEQQPRDDLLQRIFDGLDRRGHDLSGLDIEFIGNVPGETDPIVDQLVAVKSSRSTDYRDLCGGAGRARYLAGSPGYIRWPIAQADDLSRVIAKIKSKWHQQLERADGPTVLVVRTKAVFPVDGSGIQGAVEGAAGILGQVLAEHPMIGAVLLYEEPFWAPLPTITRETAAYRLAIGSSEGGHRRTAVLVPNPEARVHLTQEELGALAGPAMIW
jgi:hypothetical protein